MSTAIEKKMKRTKVAYLHKAVLLVVMASILLWLWACAAMKTGYMPPRRHLELEEEDLRYCTNCHDREEALIPYERFVHTLFFTNNHSQTAARFSDVCSMCHRPSFCSDCHGVGVELKPSIKNQTENYRRMPHRGDYLTRHRIDGRINPISCYRCHGNPKTSASCKPCHG